MISGLLTQSIPVLKPRKIRFLRIIAAGEYNPFRSTSVNLIRKPKCFFNLTYPSGSMAKPGCSGVREHRKEVLR